MSPSSLFPVTDTTIRHHLMGYDANAYRNGAPLYRGERTDFTIGVYPMLPDETCWFLAVDFDKEAWQQDAAAFLRTCAENDVPAAHGNRI